MKRLEAELYKSHFLNSFKSKDFLHTLKGFLKMMTLKYLRVLFTGKFHETINYTDIPMNRLICLDSMHSTQVFKINDLPPVCF